MAMYRAERGATVAQERHLACPALPRIQATPPDQAMQETYKSESKRRQGNVEAYTSRDRHKVAQERHLAGPKMPRVPATSPDQAMKVIL